MGNLTLKQILCFLIAFPILVPVIIILYVGKFITTSFLYIILNATGECTTFSNVWLNK
jgi:hypothetical protein